MSHISSDPESVQVLMDRIVLKYMAKIDDENSDVRTGDAVAAMKMAREARDEQLRRRQKDDPDLSTLKENELDAEIKRIQEEVDRADQEAQELEMDIERLDQREEEEEGESKP